MTWLQVALVTVVACGGAALVTWAVTLLVDDALEVDLGEGGDDE